ncbi:MAG: hypothetical protein U9N02_05940 [Campylobacterota bacterium]|nr:hypothetical protein [Campylobacterota bacterium]
MREIKQTNFKYPIVLIKILNDGRLLIVDNKTTVRYLNKEKLQITSGFKVGIDHERFKQKVVAFSGDASKFATLTSDCKEARLFNALTKKPIAKMTRHQGEVASIFIDPKDRYMFSGGEDGKTFALDLKTGKLAFTLPHHADTINEIAFSPNGNWCVTASYDRKVGVFNIATMMPKNKLKVHAAPVMKVAFIGANRFISIDKNATSIVWNTYNGKIISRLQGVHDDVREVLVTKDQLFLFLATELGHIIVYELENYKQLARSYIKLSSPISSLEFDNENNHLIIGSEDGNVVFYDIYEGRAKLKSLLTKKKYDEIFVEAGKNPLLAYTEEFAFVDNMWEKTLEKAKYFLERGDKKTAISLFDSFKNIPTKKTLINRLLQEYKNFDKFIDLAKQGKYALAYGMVRITPSYIDTAVYRSLEKRWQQSFVLAQKHVLQANGVEKARKILAPYRGISEKTEHVQELLKEGKIYVSFKKAITEKNFRRIFELVKQYSFLKEFPEYNSVISYGEKLYIKAEKAIRDDDFTTALKVLKILSDFGEFKEEAEQLKEDIENKQKFEKAIKENDILLAYNLLDNSDDLQETDDGRELQKTWNEALEKANSYAASGNIDNIEEVLKEYMEISSKYMAIASVVAWCYVTQMEKAVKSKSDMSILEDGIKKYVLTFGLRDEIESFYHICQKFYKDLEINLEALPKGSLKMWRPDMIEKSILLLK